MRLRCLLSFLLLLLVCPAFSQSPDWDQRVAFAEKVHKIKFWAYTVGDSSFRCYSDAVSAIEDILNRKGYEYMRLVYEHGDTLSPLSWKEKRMNLLKANEAFLEIRLSIHADSSERGEAGTLMVQDASGRVYAQHQLKPELANIINYTSTAEANLYIRNENQDSTAPILFYSKKTTVPNPGIGSAATISLRGIPSSHQPVARKKTTYLNKGGSTVFQFAFYGGYCSGGTISVTGGETNFKPGPDYGIEFSVNIYKGLDISLGYKREDTFAEVTAQRYPREGELPLSNNYILIGSVYKFFHKKKLQPYIGFDFGGVNVVMKDKLFRDVWYFAVGGKAGLCFYVTRVLGFRFQTQLLYQVHSKDAPFLYSNNLAVMNYSINANSNLPQLDDTLGILIRLGK